MKHLLHLRWVGPCLGLCGSHFTVWPLQGDPCCPSCAYLFPCSTQTVQAPWAPFLICLHNPLWEAVRLTLPGTYWDYCVIPPTPHPPCCLCPSCPLLTARRARVHPPALHTPGVAAGLLRHPSSRSWVAKSKHRDPWLPWELSQPLPAKWALLLSCWGYWQMTPAWSREGGVRGGQRAET